MLLIRLSLGLVLRKVAMDVNVGSAAGTHDAVAERVACLDGEPCAHWKAREAETPYRLRDATRGGKCDRTRAVVRDHVEPHSRIVLRSIDHRRIDARHDERVSDRNVERRGAPIRKDTVVDENPPGHARACVGYWVTRSMVG